MKKKIKLFFFKKYKKNTKIKIRSENENRRTFFFIEKTLSHDA